MSRAPDTWILTADCPSVLGTVDAVTRFLFEQGCYVTEHHSFDDRLSGRFFIRVEFRQPDGFDEQAFRVGLEERGKAFGMVVNLDHMLGADIEKGLVQLKTVAQGTI